MLKVEAGGLVYKVLLLLSCSFPVSANYLKQSDSNDNVLIQGIPEIPENIIDDIKPYQSISSVKALDWDENGHSLYILKRFGSVQQIHCISSPQAVPLPLTNFREPVGDARRRPGHKELLFLRDTGGNEFSQIYSLNPQTEKLIRLTDGKSRNGLPIWDFKGQKLAYQSTARNGKNMDIWLMEYNHPDKALIVLESSDGSYWEPVEFSKNGDRLLVWRNISTACSQAYLLDLVTSKQSVLTENKNFKSINRPIGFDQSQQGIWLLTDAYSEYCQIVWQRVGADFSPRILTGDIEWDIELVELSHDKKIMAFVANQGGISQLYLMNTSNDKYYRITDVPDGKISGLIFSPNDQQLAITLQTAKTPGVIYVLELGDNIYKRKRLIGWGQSDLAELDSSTFIAPILIEYPTFDLVNGKRRKIPAWLYKPVSGEAHPVIISIHGGPESQARPVFNLEFQLWLNLLGVAVIAPNVRGSRGYGKTYMSLDDKKLRENAVLDIGALLDWIELQSDLDEKKIGLHGASYGGYMVLASAVKYSARLKAVVDIFGISNFVSFLEGTQGYRQDRRREEYGDERKPDMRYFLESISPLNNVKHIHVPILIIQGNNDPRVPVKESEQMIEEIRKQNTPVWYIKVMNEGHGFKKKENINIRQQETVHFFKKYLMEDENSKHVWMQP